MRELLSILADIATILTAISAAGILYKININISSEKTANQSAKGSGNTQNIRQ
jgi:hypothetical protein